MSCGRSCRCRCDHGRGRGRGRGRGHGRGRCCGRSVVRADVEFQKLSSKLN